MSESSTRMLEALTAELRRVRKENKFLRAQLRLANLKLQRRLPPTSDLGQISFLLKLQAG